MGSVPPGRRPKNARVRGVRSGNATVLGQSTDHTPTAEGQEQHQLVPLDADDADVKSITEAILRTYTAAEVMERFQFGRVILPQLAHPGVADGGNPAFFSSGDSDLLVIRLVPGSLPAESDSSDSDTSSAVSSLSDAKTAAEPNGPRKRAFDAEDGPGAGAYAASQYKATRLDQEGRRGEVKRQAVEIRFHDKHVCKGNDCDPAFIKCRDRNCTIRVIETAEGSTSRITVEKTTDFLVDRRAIALASPFFRTMLCSSQFSDTGGSVVELHDITAAVLNVVLCIADGRFRPNPASQPFQRVTSDQNSAVEQSCKIGLGDFEQAVSKANQFLLDRPSVINWIEIWAHRSTDSSSTKGRELLLGAAYHLDAAVLFRKWSARLLVNHSAKKPITQEISCEDSDIAAPKIVFDKLESMRQEIFHLLLTRLKEIRAQCKPEDVSDFSDLLNGMNISLDGKPIKDRIWPNSLYDLRICDIHLEGHFYQLYPGSRNIHMLFENLNAPEPWRSWHQQFETLATIFKSRLSAICLDCLQQSLKVDSGDLHAWDLWAAKPMTELCRVGHREQDFRSSFTGSDQEADSILRLRAAVQGKTWVEEEKRVWGRDRFTELLWSDPYLALPNIARARKNTTVFEM